MEDKKTDERIDEPVAANNPATAGFALTPDPEIPTTATEKDEDALVHEMPAIENETALITAADLDDLVHQQPPAAPAMDTEKDIDDLLH